MAVSKVNIHETFTNRNDLSKCLNQRFNSVGVFVDSVCPGFEDVMDFASSKIMFDSTHKWLIINVEFQDTEFQNDTYTSIDEDTFNIQKTLATIDRLNTSIDSDIIVGFRKGFFDYVLYEAYNVGKIQGGNLTVQHIGFWYNSTGLMMLKNLNSYKYYDRWDFQQWAMRMIVVYSNSEPFDPQMIKAEVRPPGVGFITQIGSIVLHVVAEVHNFRYDTTGSAYFYTEISYSRPTAEVRLNNRDNRYVYTIGDRWIGPYKPNNTMVVASSLHYGYQDISPIIRMSSYTWGKIDVVHPPLTSIETRYYYRIPTYGPGKFENQFFRPLTTGSWICVMVVIALCALVLLLSAKLEHRPMPGQYAAFSVIASFCQQFFDDSGTGVTRRLSQGLSILFGFRLIGWPKTIARQIAILVTGLFCVLIYNYYTSSVVSWLLNGPPPSINSLEELLDGPLELIYEDVGYSRSWLQTPSYYYNKKNAKIEDAMRQKKVFNKKKDDPLLLPADEGIKMVKAGGYAFHTEVETANMLISQMFNQMELCELGSLQSMEKTLLFPAIQKNSPYKEFLVWSIARLSERGVVSCIQQRSSSEVVSCEGSSPRALALGGAAPAFLLLAFGYLLASVIMLLERLVYKYHNT